MADIDYRKACEVPAPQGRCNDDCVGTEKCPDDKCVLKQDQIGTATDREVARMQHVVNNLPVDARIRLQSSPAPQPEPEDYPRPAITRLREIFKELQTPGSVTHDQWEWQDAEFCVEVLNALLQNRDTVIGTLERELVAARLRADSAVHQLEDMRDKRDALQQKIDRMIEAQSDAEKVCDEMIDNLRHNVGEIKKAQKHKQQ